MGWNELPDHLKEIILSRLPLQSVFYLRSVNKGWKSLLTSKQFLQQWGLEWAPNPLLMLCSQSTFVPCLVYSFDFLNSWQTLPFFFSKADHSFCYLAATSGLVLVRVDYPSSYLNPDRRIFVCNPLTGAFRQISQTTNIIEEPAWGIAGDGYNGYKVIKLVQSTLYTVKLHVYNSAVGSWRHIPAALLETVGIVNNYEMVFCAGKFFCIISYPPAPRILVLDVDGDGNCTVLPMPEWSGTWLELLTCRGSLLVVGTTYEGDSLKDLIIWQYCCPTWREVTRMGGCLCERFKRSLNCVGVGDNVCFRKGIVKRNLEVLVYNTTRDSWYWLPKCPITSHVARTYGDYRYMTFKSLPFQPRPDMEV